MKKILFISTSRADYGLLKEVIIETQKLNRIFLSKMRQLFVVQSDGLPTRQSNHIHSDHHKRDITPVFEQWN